MKALLLGYGEIGKGMYEVLSKVHEVAIHDPAKGFVVNPLPQWSRDILLVAFPFKDEKSFYRDVYFYQEMVTPRVTIVFSTVPIGTCHNLTIWGPIEACHFPIEAKHPYISRDILLNQHHWLGGDNEDAKAFLSEAGLKFRVLENPSHTEFLKLRSTALYGINIEFARYSDEVAREINLDYSVIRDYDRFHNELVVKRGTPEHTRYLLDPPEGNIGGHCVVPNAKILDGQFPSVLLKEIYREKEKK